MRKHLTHYLVLLFTLTAFTLSGTAIAEGKHNSHDKNMNPAEKYEKIKKRKMKRMVEELNLTEEQQKQIKEIQDKQKNEFLAKKEAMHKTKKALKEAMQGEATDKELRILNDALIKAKIAFSKTRFEQVLSIRAVLTPEQRKLFKGFGRHKKGGKGKHHESRKPE